MPVLEVCVDSVDSAIAAAEGGADRIELCSALSEGGITPSLGLLRAVRSRVSIAVHVMVRPRSGDFVYSPVEFSIMQQDIRSAADEGANGVVFGMLTPTGLVDLERTTQLVKLAKPMEVTFHRAIDLVSDPLAALTQIMQSGADRVLTSGAKASALLGQSVIRQFVDAAGERIRVMACGSVRAENLAHLLEQTGAQEWHTAARPLLAPTDSPARSAGSVAEQVGSNLTIDPVRAEDVRLLREILDRHQVPATQSCSR